GKTTVIINMLLQSWFDNIIIFRADESESKYELLDQLLTEVDQQRQTDGKSLFHYITNDTSQIPSPDSFKNTSKQSLIIFDDLINSPQAFPAIQELFLRARKKNCSLCFITQEFYSIPKLIK